MRWRIKPDAGDIVASEAVPILPDDTALEVFRKVTVAAEVALHRALPALIAGTRRIRRRICPPAATSAAHRARWRHRLARPAPAQRII
jgi:methionyl-tRNA formyltransferase